MKKIEITKSIFFTGIVLIIATSSLSAQSIKKGPYLIFEGNNTEMKALWQDNASSTDVIRWGITTSYSEGTANVGEYGTDHQHAYVITGLIPGTKYYYQVEVGGVNHEGSFRAAPPASSNSLKFLAYGDTRTYPNDHNLVAEKINSAYTTDADYQTVLISMGDLISDGNYESDWADEFFETGLPHINNMFANIPYMSTRGNHEGNGILMQKYLPYDYVVPTYYSYEYGPALFIVIDQYVSYSPGSPQYIWLENQLSSSTKAWKILYYHEPGWTAAGGHGNDAGVQNYIQPLCEQYGVAITFAGHNHYYARADVTLNNTIVRHITTGGGGAPLRAPDPNQPFIEVATARHHFCKLNIIDDVTMEVEVVAKEGDIIDQFTVIQSNLVAPEVTLTSPVHEHHYATPQQIVISADATDSDGSISQVEFFVDGLSVGTDNNAPYELSWTIPSNGGYSVHAVATDNDGLTDKSETAFITVGNYSDIISVSISSGLDDVEENQNGSMYTTSTDIELVADGTRGNQVIGLRFVNLNLPQGAVINNAYVQFTVDEANSVATNLLIKGHAADNSEPFTSSTNNVSNRSTTGASVAWVPPAWNTVGASGQDQQTPDLSNIIQEIADRSGFGLNSAISIIITGTGERTAEAYEGVASSAARLVIDYTISYNSPPFFITNPVVEAQATEDSPYTEESLADNADDPDTEDILSFSKISGPAWLSVASDGSLTGTPLNNDVGVNTWTVRVEDGNGGSDQTQLQITVTNTNDPPVFTTDPITKPDATETQAYSATIEGSAVDVDAGSSLTYSIVSGPAWLAMATNGDISGTPASADVGPNSWTVAVSDGNGGTDQAILNIEVIEFTLIYCSSSGDAGYEFIAGVNLAGNESTSHSDGLGYHDYTGTTFATLEAGQSYPIILTPGWNGRSKFEYWAVWIDFDKDGVFETGERVYTGGKRKSAVSGNITIPAGLSVETRMRVSMARSSVVSSCGSVGLGEVEDYLIVIGNPNPLPPVADFTANPLSIYIGESVQFTDLSLNGPTSWYWEFGDGNASTDQNPAHTYMVADLYTISLRATNGEGFDTEIKLDYIEVLAPVLPTANFEANPHTVVEGNSVQFTDLSTGGPTSWSWAFGDGGTSTDQNPAYIYTTPGTYSVSLTVYNSQGNDNFTWPDCITVEEQQVEPYCTSSSSNNDLEYISLVNLAGLSNSSGPSPYSDFTGLTVSLNPGSNYTITVTPAFTGKSQREFFRVWIDYNKNGSFEDTGETILVVNNKKAAVSASFTVPAGLLGQTMMRVSMKNGSAPGPCEVFGGGEVEDYTVDFGAGKSGQIINQDKILSDKSFNIYPNPTADILYIDFKQWEGKKTIKLIELTGKTLLERDANRTITDIDLSLFPKGIYFLEVNDGSTRKFKKINKM